MPITARKLKTCSKSFRWHRLTRSTSSFGSRANLISLTSIFTNRYLIKCHTYALSAFGNLKLASSGDLSEVDPHLAFDVNGDIMITFKGCQKLKKKRQKLRKITLFQAGTSGSRFSLINSLL